MIEHLAHAERFWLQQAITGIADPPADWPAVEAEADEILAATPLEFRPAGPIPPDMSDEIHTVRDIALHMVEEAARHAGHLDIAREFLDGQTGLGPR